MVALRVEGADKFGKLAKALRVVGDKGLEKELYSAINRATKPMRSAARKSAERNLPRTGGLNTRVARARMSARRLPGRDVGVRIVATGMDQLALMDQGTVRHPVYGNRGRWVNQPIQKAEGWFTQPMQDGADDVRREIVKAIDSVSAEFDRKY